MIYIPIKKLFLIFQFGWEKEGDMLQPTLFPPDTQTAPEKVLKLIACKCKSASPCGRGNCFCRREQLACSIFCACTQADDSNCLNPFKQTDDDDDNDG